MSTPNSSDPKRDQTAPEPDQPATPAAPASQNANAAEPDHAPGPPAAPGAPEAGDQTSAEAPAEFDEGSFADILSEFEQQHHAGAALGQVLEGTVIDCTASGILVDIGLKREGWLALEDARDKSGELKLKAGDTVKVSVVGQTPDGYSRLSPAKVAVPRDWSGLEKAHAEGTVISGTVTGAIKGGLSVDVGARAFMPASRSGTRDAAEMGSLVGQQIRCKVIQLDTAKEDVVVDRRAVVEIEAREARQQRVAALEVGQVIQGTVRSLTDFGAFVDVGGVDGLLHVADMAWHRVKKPSDLLKVGDEVEVKVLKVDPASQRISLGRKQLAPDPWSLVDEKYEVGQRVQGPVVRLTDFGAFVQLEPGVDGMIHVSEMSWSKKVKKPADAVKMGEVVDVVVLSVNGAQRRIGLGLKQALGDPWQDVEKKFPVGSVVEGKVTNMAKFGAFIELGEGLEGMIHIADISHEKRLNHPNEELSDGQAVRAMVLEIDRSRKRIRLGLKQLQPTSADEYIAEHKVGDVVTGRVVDSKKKVSKVDLGDGVFASCRKVTKAPAADAGEPQADRPDLSALTEMLAAKWKAGSMPQGSEAEDELSPGQVRSFRIVALDAQQKKIELELAE